MSLDFLLVNPSLNWKQDQKRKITLRVNEDIPNQETPHIGMAYLLSVAKKQGLRGKYIDMVMDSYSLEQLMDYVEERKPSLVGFTAFTIQARTAAAIAAQIKDKYPHIKTCIGGPHATAIPKQTLQEFPAFDFVVCGEGELVLPKIFDFFEDETKLSELDGIVTRKKADGRGLWRPIKNLDGLPFPAWEEFDLSKYPGTYPHRTKLELPMVTGRGCPYRCVFCCRSLGDVVRHRSVSSVIGEIEHDIENFGCESIAFMDETFTIDKKWNQEFFRELKNRGLNKRVSWSCSTRVSGLSQEFLEQMKEAGCYYVFYGIESADNETLRRIKKNITTEQVRKVVRWTKQAGIVPVGAFIIGLPGDSDREVLKAIDLADELDLYSVTFPIAVPFPGTDLREMAIRGKYGLRIISDDWNHYGKQDPGVMESDNLSWDRRKELQQIAYSRHPKKNFDDYKKKLSQ